MLLDYAMKKMTVHRMNQSHLRITCHEAGNCADGTPRTTPHGVLDTHGHRNTKRLVLVPLRVVVHERRYGVKHEANPRRQKHWVSILDEVQRLVKLGRGTRRKRRRRRRR